MNQIKPLPTKNKRQNTRRVIKRIVFALMFIFAAAGVALLAQPKPVPVEVAEVERGRLVVTVDEDGKARVKDRYIVSAPLAGNLTRIELRAGDQVKQGDVLARIVPLRAPLLDARSKSQAKAEVAAAHAGVKQAQAQVARAEVALEFSKGEAQRARALLRENVVAQQEVDSLVLAERSRGAELTSAKFGAKVSAHKLAMAQAALGHYKAHSDDEILTVTSPISGRVLKLIQQSEGVMQAGSPLLELGDPEALEIVVDVLTSDAVRISPGSPAQVEEWGGEALDAVVKLVEPSAFTRISALGVEEQRVNAIIELNGPYESWAKLGDGYRVEARIEVYREDAALIAPQSALFRHQGEWSTFVIVDGLARRRRLKIGPRNETHAVIEEGLKEGEAIVIHPSGSVEEGVKLKEL